MEATRHIATKGVEKAHLNLELEEEAMGREEIEFNYTNEKDTKAMGILLSFSMKWGMKGIEANLRKIYGRRMQ